MSIKLVSDVDEVLEQLKLTQTAIHIENIDITWDIINQSVITNEMLTILLAKTSCLPLVPDFTAPDVVKKLGLNNEQSALIQNFNSQLIHIQGLIQKLIITEYVTSSIFKEMIDNGTLKDGDELLHLDADMRIDKFKNDYPCDKSFSVCIDNGNSFCMGSYKMKINEWSKKLVNDILDEDLWNKNKNTPHWQAFREQAAFYTLCGIFSHSWVSFLTLPDYGWHQHKTEDTKYSLEELHKNVQILGPEWNTTLLAEEYGEIGPALMQYNITRSKKEDTIIRHFAGGQQWRI
jgi:hypothetical protein